MKRVLLTLSLLALGAAPLTTLAQTTPRTTPAAPTTFPSGYTLAQLNAVDPLVRDLKTLQGTRLDLQRGRVVVVGLSAVDRLALIVRLKQAGLPTGLVDYQTPEQAGVNQEIPGTGTAPATPAPATPAPATPRPPPRRWPCPTSRPCPARARCWPCPTAPP